MSSVQSDTHNPGIVNTLWPKQSGRHSADDISKCLFVNENVRIPVKISLNCILDVRIDDIPALSRVMAGRRSGDKLLSDQMMVSLPTPQGGNGNNAILLLGNISLDTSYCRVSMVFGDGSLQF